MIVGVIDWVIVAVIVGVVDWVIVGDFVAVTVGVVDWVIVEDIVAVTVEVIVRVGVGDRVQGIVSVGIGNIAVTELLSSSLSRIMFDGSTVAVTKTFSYPGKNNAIFSPTASSEEFWLSLFN